MTLFGGLFLSGPPWWLLSVARCCSSSLVRLTLEWEAGSVYAAALKPPDARFGGWLCFSSPQKANGSLWMRAAPPRLRAIHKFDRSPWNAKTLTFTFTEHRDIWSMFLWWVGPTKKGCGRKDLAILVGWWQQFSGYFGCYRGGRGLLKTNECWRFYPNATKFEVCILVRWVTQNCKKFSFSHCLWVEQSGNVGQVAVNYKTQLSHFFFCWPTIIVSREAYKKKSEKTQKVWSFKVPIENFVSGAKWQSLITRHEILLHHFKNSAFSVWNLVGMSIMSQPTKKKKKIIKKKSFWPLPGAPSKIMSHRSQI